MSVASAPTGRVGPPPALPEDEPDPPPPSRLHRRQGRIGLVFASPWVIGFFVLYALPMAASLWFSFTDFNLTSAEPTSFVGLDNWRRLFGDPEVINSAWVTVKFGVLSLPFTILVPLGFAYLLTSKNLWGRSFFRTLFYLPSVIPFVAAVLVFNGMLNSQTGWANRALGAVGIPGPNWLNSEVWIYPTLTLIALWGVGNAMIIFIAGMNSVPEDLYDAAAVDGAGSLAMFRHVTIPLISPVLFYNIVVALIGLFQYFLVPFVLKNGSGDPNGSTFFYSMYFYRTLFRLQNMGYAATLAWMLFIAGVVVTGVLFWSAKYWVHYEFGERS
ncbi:carbohydrate ABC transporter permease [Euzebya tangerina]|uniref:carbohydrate ABC transporter permease n=1 Tax=Euzebya tangerina TaxID=591198 RepID=UPI000E31E84E|nr:sugar ABC transporter permease [Euzebya tangerina]